MITHTALPIEKAATLDRGARGGGRGAAGHGLGHRHEPAGADPLEDVGLGVRQRAVGRGHRVGVGGAAGAREGVGEVGGEGGGRLLGRARDGRDSLVDEAPAQGRQDEQRGERDGDQGDGEDEQPEPDRQPPEREDPVDEPVHG